MLKLYSEDGIPLRQAVYQTLRSAILKGELMPGERLMEIHLANELGVSRTPVREAIQMLEKEGLAKIMPRRGAEVTRMTIKDLEDVMDIRICLDVLAVRKACDNINDDEVIQLENILREFKELLEGNNIRKMVECDERFHDTIYKATDNPKLIQIIATIREQMYRYRYEYLKDRKEYYPILYREHEAILNCIKKGDKDCVERTSIKHLEEQYSFVREKIISYNQS